MPVLIVLIAGIGDLILASKSFRAIRNGFPDSEIHLLTSADAAPLARQYKYIDQIWEFPIRELRSRKSVLFNMLKIVLQLRRIKYAMIINLHPVATAKGAFQMGLLFSLLRAPVKIAHDYKGFGLFVNKKVPADNFRNRHYAESFLDVALLAGGKPDSKGIEVCYNLTSKEKWGYLFNEKSINQHSPTVAINPGSDQPKKRLHPDRLADIADRLVEQCNARIILLGGPGEMSISQHIQDTMNHDAINLAGKLTLNDLVYIISQLDLLITNDSAPMHIAAALNIKQVAIFGPGYPELFRPYTSSDNYILIYKHLDCRPCNNKECGHISCIESITSEEVFEAANTLLTR